jgi:hypothetical protein
VADDELRQFMHELLMRFERRTQAMERRLDAQTEQLREQTAQMADMRDAIRANTRAVLHALDQLRGRGPAQA